MPDDSPPSSTFRITPVDEAATRALADAAGVSQITARILLARGLNSPEAVRRFLTPTLDRDWRDPETLPGMPACADTVADAVRAGVRIVVFGDFDVDGLTAAAVVARGLRAFGADVVPVVPHRFDEGYGLTSAVVERVLGHAPALVVTVDCGISSAAEVGTLLAAGVAVVVTDHHEPGDGVPVGVPVCDPKLRVDGPDVFDGLAGAGVALKLVAAVGRRLGLPEVWRGLTGLAALGTVADVVPLVDENRALVADGITRMRRDPLPGIESLCALAGADVRELSADSVAFLIGPRLNAAGRISDPTEALDLLMTDDPQRAAELAGALDEYNRIRQRVEAELLEEASAQAESVWRDGTRVLVLAGEAWHEGVKGIVAARIASRYGVPALLFCIEDGEARGSGRSAGGIDLYSAVARCSGLLTRFGGHAAAVGVTLPACDIERFAECLRGELETAPASAFVAHTVVDALLHLPGATRELAAELAALEPFGSGNPRPVLASLGVFMGGRKRVGQEGTHLKFEAYDGLASLSAIAFRCQDIEALVEREAAVDIAYTLETDTWQGRERVQLLVRRIESRAPAPDGPAAALVDELFADADRILARGEYEGIADAESFHTKLAGVTFEGRQDVVARLEPGTPLRLVRQADNEFDSNAIAVFDPVGDQVGFLNRRLAAVLAPQIDKGGAWEVAVSEVTGGTEDTSRGVNVLVARAGTSQGVLQDEEARLERRAALGELPPGELDDALVRALIGAGRLHPAQTESLRHLDAGRSCLTVMATGRGKSLIFQLHAARIALRRGEASVLVYPLRALVADQAFHLTDAFAALGLRVAVVTGESSPTGRDEVFASLADGRIAALMTTPEFLERHASRFAECGRVRFIVVDEAHHVGLARAGHRPAYARLGDALAVLGGPTVCAVTATASDEVASAIRESLGISSVVLDPSRRDNLRVVDRRGRADKVEYVSTIAAVGQKLIVYVNSREQSVRIAQKMRDSSPALTHRVAFYNGGVARAARHAVERAFREGDLTTVVATSAFGEGVNVADVRHVALFHLPFNHVEFNQMCGRAGRDGATADVHLLFGERDGRINELVLEAGAPDLEDLRALYVALRDRAASEDGWVDVTNAELAADVKSRRPRARLTDKGVSAGLGIFREVGLVTGEGTGAYRRLMLLPVEGKTDLTSSVRYAEGLEEADGFAAFRRWVLDSPAEVLRHAFDRPILPGV